MQQILLNQPTRKSLFLNIGIFLLIQIVISFMVFGFGWDKGHNAAFIKRPYVAPSGAIVGSVWLVLYF